MPDFPLDSADLTWLARLARALLREPHAADDLLQDTVTATLEAETLPAPGGRRRAWIAGVARNLAMRRFRDEGRRSRREQAVAAERDGVLPSPADLVERAELAERVAAAARALDEPFRSAILLRFLDGHSVADIARLEGKPEDTVRRRVRRGLELLREELTRRHGRGADWAAWSVALIPLARSAVSGNTVGAAAAVGGGATLWTGVLMSGVWMKLKWVGVAAVAALALGIAGSGLWRWSGDPTGGKGEEPAPAIPSSATLSPAGSDGMDRGGALARVETVEIEGSVERSEVPSIELPRGLRGRVVDASGKPVAGAIVYLVPSPQARGETRAGSPAARTEADRRGRFVFEERSVEDVAAARLDLGVRANGFLHAIQSVAADRALGVGRQPGEEGPSEEIVVVLDRGERLTGRVVDEFARPVSGLRLIAHADAVSIAHVSPSQVELRASRAALGDAESRYEDCYAKTDARGEVTFEGLPADAVRVRSLDAGWILTEPGRVVPGDPFVTWTARRCFGVRVEVVDAASGAPLDRVRAVFRVVVSLSDGSEQDFGQWVGRGRGGASFVLTSELLPDLGGPTIERAEFYGQVEVPARPAGSVQVDWRAVPIERTEAGDLVARVRVEVDAATADVAPEEDVEAPAAAAEPAPAVLELDVRYPDSTPFDGALVVDWRARVQGDRGATDLEGSERATQLAPGRYRVPVVAGDVDLRVKDRNASGSLPPWIGRVVCRADRPTLEFVVLPRGGAVSIVRPRGWTGEWFVRVSWRRAESDEWRGSWIHSTVAETLELSALEPVFWRFELRPDETSRGEPEFVRTCRLAEGETRVVVD